MNPVTLVSLAQRVEAIERAMQIRPFAPGRDDWQRVVGMFAGQRFYEASR